MSLNLVKKRLVEVFFDQVWFEKAQRFRYFASSRTLCQRKGYYFFVKVKDFAKVTRLGIFSSLKVAKFVVFNERIASIRLKNFLLKEFRIHFFPSYRVKIINFLIKLHYLNFSDFLVLKIFPPSFFLWTFPQLWFVSASFLKNIC